MKIVAQIKSVGRMLVGAGMAMLLGAGLMRQIKIVGWMMLGAGLVSLGIAIGYLVGAHL